jgi:hypothetical protein
MSTVNKKQQQQPHISSLSSIYAISTIFMMSN